MYIDHVKQDVEEAIGIQQADEVKRLSVIQSSCDRNCLEQRTPELHE